MKEIRGSGLILIVDDTPTNLSLLTQVLADAGFEVAIATSGERALKQLEMEQPDLILLDIMMPGIGGFETCRRIKADTQLKSIPVIFMTALSDLENKVKALELGAVDYITKPFQEKEVVDRITIHIELSKTQLKLQRSEARLESILDSVQEVVWSGFLDPFEITYLNPSVEEIYGLPPQALIDSPHYWIGRIVEEDADSVRKHLSGTPDCGAFELEYRVHGFDGKLHWIQCRANIQRDELEQRFRVDGILHDITERRLVEQKLVSAAQKDSLTELANRAFFIDQLNQSLAMHSQQQSSKIALLFIDLDRFKDINDSLGHSVGDALLIHVSQLLIKAVRPTDFVARLGGDEFTIFLNDIHLEEDVLNICDRIQTCLAQPIKLGEYSLAVTASIGVVISSNTYRYADHMLRDADIAMYEAKRHGKARYQIFSQEMYEQVAYKISLESELRSAVRNKELFLEYQPILNLETEELTGFEALVRWQHPILGLVPPCKFIPLAEETDLIIEIGNYVLGEACRQLKCWMKEYPTAKKLTMSVNISSPQLEKENFFAGVRRALAQASLSAQNINIEITETSLIKNTQTSWQNLRKLQEEGIRVSLDDFGTGYSSLSYLIKFPVDTLKIDRSFVSTLESSHSSIEVIRAVINLARTLGMTVVAEGVETASQGLALKKLNCDMVQGYLYSRPLSVEKATEYLQQTKSPVLLVDSVSA
ncbi:MAG: EAL domain-containing protein [Phormidesmis sp.]